MVGIKLLFRQPRQQVHIFHRSARGFSTNLHFCASLLAVQSKLQQLQKIAMFVYKCDIISLSKTKS